MTFPKGGLEKNLYSCFIFSFLKKKCVLPFESRPYCCSVVVFFNLLLLFKKN